MTRTSRAKTGSRQVSAAAGWDRPLAVVAAAGVALTAVLAYTAWSRANLPFCPAGGGCDIVQSSRWSTLLGLPIAAWGCGLYLALLGVALRPATPQRRWRSAAWLAGIGLAISLYLTAVAWLELRAKCNWCLLSLGLLGVVFLLSLLRTPGGAGIRWWAVTGLSAAVVVGLLHLHYAGVFDPAAGPEDPYRRALAEHLRESGATFYGAYWCPHCRQQKALFAAAARHLPYVECSPHGPQSPQATECLVQNVKNYPTWVVGGQRYERILTLEQLARLTGFEPPP